MFLQGVDYLIQIMYKLVANRIPLMRIKEKKQA